MSRYGTFRTSLAKNLEASEHDIQSTFIRALEATGRREVAVGFAIPNAAKRSFRLMASLRAEGFRTGMPDWCLPVARGGYNNLWIEFKRPKQKPTPAQVLMHDLLKENGGKVVVMTDALAAVECVLDYLNTPPDPTHDRHRHAVA